MRRQASKNAIAAALPCSDNRYRIPINPFLVGFNDAEGIFFHLNSMSAPPP
jgi:hypothetical protein